MGTAAATATDASALGNVGPSRQFQFAESAIMKSSQPKNGPMRWTPSPVDGLTTIKNRTIYAFELATEGEKPKLAAEFIADDRGALRYVSGQKRRGKEPAAAGAGDSVKGAWADLIRQVPSKKQAIELRYVFIAIRGRLSARAISDIEDDLPAGRMEPVFQKWNLADPYTFKSSSNTDFVMVIDPITILENLSKAYQTALIYAYDYIVPYEGNPHQKDVAIRARKLQLGRMIKQSLLVPDADGNVTDPLKIKGSLKHWGSDLLEFVSNETKALDAKALNLKSTSVELVRFLESDVWAQTHGWYRGTPHGEETIEHAYLDAHIKCLDRLCETQAGKDYEKKIAEELESGTGILTYLFAPPEQEGAAMESFRRKANIGRRLGAAYTIGFVETLPAVKLWCKVRGPAIIVATLNFWFKKSTQIVAVGRRGRFAAALRIRTRTKMHIHVNYKKVKVDLSKWLEEGKAHWPPGSKEAELAELVTKLFIAVEVVNLYNKLTDMVQTFSSQTSDATKKWTRAGEVVAATMDLVVAFEDPARAWAEEMSAIRFDEWRRLHPHAKPTELAEAKEEVAGVFGKLSKPATFKWIGALSAALDTAIYFVEGREAWHKGEHGVAVGNYLVSGGSFLMLVGNVVSAVSIAAATEGVTAATAAAAAFASIAIVIGVIIVMIGFALVEYFHETPWQTFADRCCFGKHPGKAGHEKWSGGDFSKWTLTEEGLDRQIEVLTAMLCAFRAEGDTGDNHTIRLYFGVVAPKSRLTLEFSISYENGQNQKLEYEIELDKINPALKKAKSEQPGAENAESEQPGTENAESEPHGGSHRTPDAIGLEIRNKRFVSMVVRAERLVSGPVKNSTCEVAIRFAGSSAKVPVEGEFKYQLVENGHIHSTEMDSLDVGPEE